MVDHDAVIPRPLLVFRNLGSGELNQLEHEYLDTFMLSRACSLGMICKGVTVLKWRRNGALQGGVEGSIGIISFP